MRTNSPPAAGTPTPSSRALDRTLIHGIAWTGGGKWVTQIISWIATPIVARLLSPADYGVASMAMLYVGLVQLVTEFGLGTAIVQRRELGTDQVARLGGVAILFGAFFFALSMALAAPVADFFGNADLRPVIMVLSVMFLASSVQTVPRALLARDLRFGRLAALDAAEALGATVVTLTLAFLGLRYWSLVLGGLAGRVASTTLSVFWRRHRVRWPLPLTTVAGPVTFGLHLVGSNIAWYTFLNADLAIIGRRLGSAALGAYHIGLSLASIPVDRLSALVARVTPAILAKVQHDPPALRRYVLGITEGTSLLAFPAAIGLALVASEFVLVVLGERWRAAITPLRLLALAAIFRSLMPLFGQVLYATGASKKHLKATVATAVVLLPLFYVGSFRGTAGVALVWLVAYPILAATFSMRYAFAVCDIRLRVYLRALWPAGSATLVMAGIVLAVDLAAPDDWPLAVLLGLKVAAGATSYLGLVAYLHGSRLRSALAMMRAREVPQAATGPERSASGTTRDWSAEPRATRDARE